MSEPVLPAPRPTRLGVLLEREEVRRTYEEKRRQRGIRRQARLEIDYEIYGRHKGTAWQRQIRSWFAGAKWPPKRKRPRR